MLYFIDEANSAPMTVVLSALFVECRVGSSEGELVSNNELKG